MKNAALTDADFDLDNMFPTPAIVAAQAGPKLVGRKSDAEIAEDDNRRAVRSPRQSRSKVR